MFDFCVVVYLSGLKTDMMQKSAKVVEFERKLEVLYILSE